MSLSFTQSKLYTMENTMRKLPMLLVLPLSVLIFASCGGDDDDGPQCYFLLLIPGMDLNLLYQGVLIQEMTRR